MAQDVDDLEVAGQASGAFDAVAVDGASEGERFVAVWSPCDVLLGVVDLSEELCYPTFVGHGQRYAHRLDMLPSA